MRSKLRSNGRVAAAIAKTPATPALDKWLHRIASASQLGVLLLAVFGYFYTVLPVYQKSLLDEEIAKKTFELNRKDAELSVKSAELAALSSTVARAKETARLAQAQVGKAQAEVGKLKSSVREQYSELRPRLLREFANIAQRICSFDRIPTDTFAACVRENAAPTGNLLALLPNDKKTLQTIVDDEAPLMRLAWQQKSAAIEARRQRAVEGKDAAERQCEKEKDGDAYKDGYKKIEVDYRCNVARLNANSESIKADLARTFAASEFMSERLEAILKAFQAKAISPQ